MAVSLLGLCSSSLSFGTGVRADHLKLVVLTLLILISTSICILLQFFLRVFWHPEARLDPGLLGHHTKHSALLTLHVKDGLSVGLLCSIKLVHPLSCLGCASTRNTHLCPVEFLNLLDDFLLLLFSLK